MEPVVLAGRVLSQIEGLKPRVLALPGTEPDYKPWPYGIHPDIKRALGRVGMEDLYSHQVAAYDAWRQGNDVAVVTGTSSGKTLCFNLPVLQSCMEEPKARALYLYPTKALAQDQAGKLESLSHLLPFHSATYDGDTPKNKRSAIRNNANIVLTNPDMLHVGILPQHELWGSFFRSLRIIVLDEMHAYRGVFGTHLAFILRRLLRLCEWYGSKPRIIGCSATIANVEEHFEELTGRRPFVIDFNGAPGAYKAVYMISPDEVEQFPTPNSLTSEILFQLIKAHVPTLAFCRSRNAVELVLRSTQAKLAKDDLPTTQVEGYRGGYTPAERRAIEKRFFDRGSGGSDSLTGLVSTSAMEMGVDVGSLGAVIINGFPGSMSSFWQQAGRAGRGKTPGACIYLAGQDPFDQYFVRNSGGLLSKSIESAVVQTANPQIMGSQLLCAAFERPIAPAELAGFGPTSPQVIEGHVEAKMLDFSSGRFFFASYESPAAHTNIRGSNSGQVTLFEGTEPIGSMEFWRALQFAHEGALYLHRGQNYRVELFRPGDMRANLIKTDLDAYTMPSVSSVVEPVATLDELAWGQRRIALKVLKVTQLVSGYREFRLDSGGAGDYHELDSPPLTVQTVGVQLLLPEEMGMEEDPEWLGSLHGAEHALLTTAPFLAGCDRADLNSAWFPYFYDSRAPTLFFYDAMEGGIGLSEKLFANRQTWAEMAHELMVSCPCQDGCAKCLHIPRCESANEALSKVGAIALIESLLI